MNNHLPEILKAINYIEDHIKENLSIGDVAKHVGFSKYHFTRVFKEVANYTPSDYYRGRKVTLALEYMAETQCKIIEAAFEFGFNSPEVFTRSCLSAFNQSPSQIKKLLKEDKFTGIDRLSKAQITIYSNYQSLNIEAAYLPPIFIKGISYTSSNFFGTLDWNKEVLEAFINTKETVYYLHWQSKESPNLFYHLVGTSINLDETFTEDNFSSYVYKKIPGREYLIFPLVEDGQELESMKDYIYDYYMPQNKYISDGLFNVEVISFGCQGKPNKSLLYVPATKKNKRS